MVCSPFIIFLIFIIIFTIISLKYILGIIENNQLRQKFIMTQFGFFIIWLFTLYFLCKSKYITTAWILTVLPILFYTITIVYFIYKHDISSFYQ